MGSKHHTQHGQTMALAALSMVALIGFAALAFDLGWAMSNRRDVQAYSDSAALAGTRVYPSGTAAQAHYIAMQYLAKQLAFSLPLGSCTSASACPSGSYTSGSFTITLTDSTAIGTSGQAVPTLDVAVQQSMPSIFGRVIGVNVLQSGASARATGPGPVFDAAVYALAAVSGDALIHGGGTSSPTGNVSGAIYANGSFGSNNGPHAPDVPAVQTNYDGTACPGSPSNHLDNGGNSNSLSFNWKSGSGTRNSNVSAPYFADNVGPTTSGPTYTTAAQAKDSSGNWKPGIYNGIFPTGGHMNGGVYKIINVATAVGLGAVTNTTHTASGTSEGANAVAIVLDSSDTGSLDLSSAALNGIDDLYGSNYTGNAQRDPAATHNFVVFGGNGATGYKGSVTVGPGATTDISGILYLPQSAYTSNGNSSPKWTGSITFASLTINGGGNGTQVFDWVCGLSAVAGNGSDGGLVR